MASSMSEMHYCSDAHDRDTDQESYIACSIASSTETADDLPGAGRTLGKFYNAAGRFLERRVGAIVEKLGYGPRATVVRIQRQRLIVVSKHKNSKYWREEIDEIGQILKDGRHLDVSEYPYQFLRDFSSGLPSSKEKDRMEKYCKRLLGYVSSNVESTKKQAIDIIIEFAFEDKYVRESLKSMGAVNVLESLKNNPALWINYGAPLQSRACRALIVLGDTEMHTLALKAKESLDFPNYGRDRRDENVVCLEALADYLNHPTYSFVAARYLRQLVSNNRRTVLHVAVRGIAKAINANCNIIEFEECDRILEIWVNLCFEGLQIDEDLPVLETIFRYTEKLPRTVSVFTFNYWHNDLGTVNPRSHRRLRVHAHYRMSFLIKGIEALNRSGNEDLRATYSHPDLIRLLQSPADIALSKFAYTVRLSYRTSGEGIVTGAEELKSLCDEVVYYASSTDSQIRERAWHCAKELLVTDNYCHTAILKALSSTRICYPADFVIFAEVAKRRSYPPRSWYSTKYIRHCDAEGKLLYLTDEYHRTQYGNIRRCVIENEIDIDYSEVLTLRVERGTAFSSTGHYPILAGHTVNGERAYLAEAHFGHDYWPLDCFITEGTKPEDLRIWVAKKTHASFEERTPISVDVFVLRWALDMYPEEFRSYGLDATGPFSWEDPYYFCSLRRTRYVFG